MRAKQSAARALAAGVLSLALSCAMLLGTTYAWFIDTASTAVNTIEAGSLDVSLEMKTGDTWVDAVGETLQWAYKYTPSEGESGTYTWQPVNSEAVWSIDDRFALPPIRVVNKGDLNLKYRLVLNVPNTLTADEKAAFGALEWYVETSVPTLLSESETGKIDLAARRNVLHENTLKPASESTGNTCEFFISAKLPKSAVTDTETNQFNTLYNKIKNQNINGISITVLAAQQDAEYDSIDKTYDKDALYCALATPVNRTRAYNVTIDADGNIAELDSANQNTHRITLGKSTFYDYTTGPQLKAYTTSTASDAGLLKGTTGILEEKITTSGTVNRVTYSISHTFTPSGGGATQQIQFFSKQIGYPFQLSRDLTSVTLVSGSGTFGSYTGTSGELVLNANATAELTVQLEYQNFGAAVDGQGYTTWQDALDAAQNGSTVVLLKDVTDFSRKIDKKITINMAGHSITGRENSTTFTVEKGGDLTVIGGDSTTDTGVLASTNTAFDVKAEGKLTVKNLSITAANNGIVNAGTVGEISNVSITKTDSSYASTVGLSNSGQIGTVEKTSINGFVTGVNNISGHAITDLKGVAIDVTGIGINNGGTIGTISDSESVSSSIKAGGQAIVNTNTITSIVNTDINATGDAIKNAANNSTIGTISGVTIKTASEGIWNNNSGSEITTIENTTVNAAKRGIINDAVGEIGKISNVAITAGGYAMQNSGQIGTIENTSGSTCEIKGTTGLVNYSSGTVGKISNMIITGTTNGGIANDGTIGTIGAAESGIVNCSIAGVTSAISNSGTISQIVGSPEDDTLETLTSGADAYSIIVSGNGKIGKISGVRVAGGGGIHNSGANSTITTIENVTINATAYDGIHNIGRIETIGSGMNITVISTRTAIYNKGTIGTNNSGYTPVTPTTP